jgi:hypothetical protein
MLSKTSNTLFQGNKDYVTYLLLEGIFGYKVENHMYKGKGVGFEDQA